MLIVRSFWIHHQDDHKQTSPKNVESYRSLPQDGFPITDYRVCSQNRLSDFHLSMYSIFDFGGAGTGWIATEGD